MVIVAAGLGIAALLAAPGLAFGKNAFVERTGQTECWDEDYPYASILCADTGHDGDLQSGVRLPKPRFKDLGNGWVLDRVTALEWLKDAYCPGDWVTWQSAWEFVELLNDVDGYCDQANDHRKPARLPNVRELQSLIHYGWALPAVSSTDGTGQWTEGDPFFNLRLGWYWSSTTSTLNHGYAWRVSFDYGYTDGLWKDYWNGMVWPVRGGKR